MDRITTMGAFAALALALLLALAATTTAAAQQALPHLVTEVIKGDDGTVMGYKIHHERHHTIYVAMLAPGSAGTSRCATSDDYIEITEGRGAPHFYGSDGEPCTFSVFAPDVNEKGPPLRPPADLPAHPCPSCPSR